MLAKLISLLIHAKSGAISGVLLLGATGALVSVSATNGVTTITITEASPSPSTAVSHQESPTTSPTASPSPSPSAASPQLSSPSSTACTDAAKTLALQVQRVDAAFSGFHTDLVKLRGTRDAATLEKADTMLKLVRQSAVKAIHATAAATCVKQDDADEDKDENDTDADEDDTDDQNGDTDDRDKSQVPATVTTLSFVVETSNDEENDGRDRKPGLTFTGDATAIADQAIAAMQVAFDAAKNAAVTAPKAPTHQTEATTKGAKVGPSKSADHKGEHDD